MSVSDEVDISHTLPMELDLQFHLLKMMVKSESFLNLCKEHLIDEYFDNKVLGWFFNNIVKYYETYRKPPELITLKNELTKFDAEERPIYERAFDKIDASRYSDEDYLCEELTGWLRSRKFFRSFEEAAELFNTNRKDDAYEFTNQTVKDILSIDFTKDDRISFDNLLSDIDRLVRSNINRIPIGIPEIDAVLLGGLPRQTLTTVLGVTNTGKSVVLTNMAYHAMMHGKKVVYVYHEGEDDQLKYRFISRQTKIPYSKFYNGLSCFSEDEKQRILHAETILKDRLVLKPWPEIGLSVGKFAAYCRKLKAEFDFDMLIDDYAQLLSSTNRHKEYRHGQAEVFRSLNQLAAELNVALVTAAQSNRAGAIDLDKGKRLLSMTDLSECFDIAMASACVLTITRTTEDDNNNRIRILLEKQRDGKTKVGVECKTDFSKLIAYDQNLGFKSLRLTDKHEIVQDLDEDMEVITPGLKTSKARLLT